MTFIEQILLMAGNGTVPMTVLVFLAMLFVGEPIVLAVAFYTATTALIPFPLVLLIAYITALIGELFWFWIGHTSFVYAVTQRPAFVRGIQDLNTLLARTRLTHPVALLLSTRIFTGITIVAIIYLAQKNLSLRRFVLYSLIVNAFWSPIVVGIGYAAGKGYTAAIAIFESIRFSVEIGLVVLLCLYFEYKILIHRILKRT